MLLVRFVCTGIRSTMNRYFQIDWNVLFGMNPPPVQIHLIQVYLTLFCTLMSSASGAYLHLLWNIGGLLTLLACIGTGMCLILAQLWNEWKGVPLLLVTAFCQGASIGPLFGLVFKTDPGIIFTAYVAIAVAFGCFSVAAMLSHRRGYIYLGGLLSSSHIIPIWLEFASTVFGDYPIFWKCVLKKGAENDKE
ncbi:unnamed protein product [Ilex paraguariensis]|uniref:Uncharacterized protein n=1 Tax=Ilex paraguariensis TaxID=185542 RepID=A0ABC8RWR5_9AQUA